MSDQNIILNKDIKLLRKKADGTTEEIGAGGGGFNPATDTVEGITFIDKITGESVELGIKRDGLTFSTSAGEVSLPPALTNVDIDKAYIKNMEYTAETGTLSQTGNLTQYNNNGIILAEEFILNDSLELVIKGNSANYTSFFIGTTNQITTQNFNASNTFNDGTVTCFGSIYNRASDGCLYSNRNFKQDNIKFDNPLGTSKTTITKKFFKTKFATTGVKVKITPYCLNNDNVARSKMEVFIDQETIDNNPTDFAGFTEGYYVFAESTVSPSNEPLLIKITTSIVGSSLTDMIVTRQGDALQTFADELGNFRFLAKQPTQKAKDDALDVIENADADTNGYYILTYNTNYAIDNAGEFGEVIGLDLKDAGVNLASNIFGLVDFSNATDVQDFSTKLSSIASFKNNDKYFLEILKEDITNVLTYLNLTNNNEAEWSQAIMHMQATNLQGVRDEVVRIQGLSIAGYPAMLFTYILGNIDEHLAKYPRKTPAVRKGSKK